MIDYQKIANSVELEICPVHGESPKVTLNEDSFQISSCCETFREEMIEKFKEYLKIELQDSIRKSLFNR